jgi:hypothetical protein
MGGSSPEVKRSEREAHHSSPSMQFNNAWSFTFAPIHLPGLVFMHTQNIIFKDRN